MNGWHEKPGVNETGGRFPSQAGFARLLDRSWATLGGTKMRMTTQLPDLWRARADPDRMYQLYLARLQMNGLHDRVVAACRQIRRYAARGHGVRCGYSGIWAIEHDIAHHAP